MHVPHGSILQIRRTMKKRQIFDLSSSIIDRSQSKWRDTPSSKNKRSIDDYKNRPQAQQSTTTMKFTRTIALALSLPAATQAFAPALFGTTTARPSTLLQTTARPDASSAIQEALAASKQFGPTSPEARIAWEAVEDMDSSDTRCVQVAAPCPPRSALLKFQLSSRIVFCSHLKLLAIFSLSSSLTVRHPKDPWFRNAYWRRKTMSATLVSNTAKS